jgi:hypothetical protein
LHRCAQDYEISARSGFIGVFAACGPRGTTAPDWFSEFIRRNDVLWWRAASIEAHKVESWQRQIGFGSAPDITIRT